MQPLSVPAHDRADSLQELGNEDYVVEGSPGNGRYARIAQGKSEQGGDDSEGKESVAIVWVDAGECIREGFEPSVVVGERMCGKWFPLLRVLKRDVKRRKGQYAVHEKVESAGNGGYGVPPNFEVCVIPAQCLVRRCGEMVHQM